MLARDPEKIGLDFTDDNVISQLIAILKGCVRNNNSHLNFIHEVFRRVPYIIAIYVA